MRAGKLRHEVTIEQYSESVSTKGDPVKSWSDFATGVWASIEPVSGREAFISQQLLASVTHVVRLRYLSGVSPKMRVKYGSRYFRIEVVRDLEERDREMVLACTEVVGGRNE